MPGYSHEGDVALASVVQRGISTRYIVTFRDEKIRLNRMVRNGIQMGIQGINIEKLIWLFFRIKNM